MPTVTIDGLPYAYDEAGQGSALLLVHAGIADRRMWDDVLPHLSDRHRVVRLDLRGYGDTPLPDGPFVYASDAAELLEALGISRAHVCGISMGAGVALDLALGRPELVDRLVLVCPGLSGWEWDASMEEFDSAEAAALEQLDLDEASWLNVRFWVDGPSRMPDEVDAALRQRVYEMQRRAFEWENPEAEGSWLVKEEQHRLGEITTPTLIVVGELDQPDFAAIGSRMAEGIPNARLELMPAVAHLPPMEAPEVFARLLLDHLSG